VIAAAGCNKQGGGPPPGGGAFGVPVTAVAAVSKDVPVYIDEIGKIVASESVTIQPQVSGIIISRHFVDGANLKKGDLLFQIDPRPFQAQLEQAKGQLAKDTAQKISSDWNVSQDRSALKSNAIAEQQLHTDISARDQAAAAMAVDQASIEYAKLNVEYCSILSPIDGRAGARLVDAGNVVTAAGQAPGTNLLSIQKVDPIYADFTINEAVLLKVQQYMAQGPLTVTVQLPEDAIAAAGPIPATQPTNLPPGQAVNTPAPAVIGIPSPQQTGSPVMPATQTAPLELPRVGKLIFLDNAVQDGSGTVKLRALLPNSDRHFWPGQFANVRLVLKVQKDAVLVPAQAVQISQLGPFVYVVDSNGAAQAHPVVQGQRQGDMVVIESGVVEGDSVVVTGQTLLQPGGKVMVVNAPHMGGPAAPGAPGAVPSDVKKSAMNDSTNNVSEGKAS
jgi:multidrug efflux system membrane fusion protein